MGVTQQYWSDGLSYSGLDGDTDQQYWFDGQPYNSLPLNISLDATTNIITITGNEATRQSVQNLDVTTTSITITATNPSFASSAVLVSASQELYVVSAVSSVFAMRDISIGSANIDILTPEIDITSVVTDIVNTNAITVVPVLQDLYVIANLSTAVAGIDVISLDPTFDVATIIGLNGVVIEITANIPIQNILIPLRDNAVQVEAVPHITYVHTQRDTDINLITSTVLAPQIFATIPDAYTYRMPRWLVGPNQNVWTVDLNEDEWIVPEIQIVWIVPRNKTRT